MRRWPVLALLVAASAVAQTPNPPGPQAPPARPGTEAQRPPEATAKPLEPPSARPPEANGDWQQRANELWKQRDQQKAIAELNKLLKDELSKDPMSFEANLRNAMLQCWNADGLKDGSELKAALGKGCWESADKAISVKPDDARAQYWAAVGIGLYSEGVGILTALSQGLEGKFKSRAQASIRLDKDYLLGSPNMLMGRFFYKLPWPKRDVGQSLQILGDVAKAHPDNLLNKLYLADSLDSDGKGEQARKLVQEIVGVNATDPQDRRTQEKARRWLASH